MYGKGISILMLALCVFAGSGTFALNSEKDKNPPVISYEKGAITYDGENTESLLKGVTSTDAHDGDVSASLIVSDIYQTSDATGVVVYSAKDAANNVTLKSRGFFYEGHNVAQLMEANEMQTKPAGDIENDEQDMKESNLASGIPFLHLVVHAVNLEKGNTFNVYRYIGEIVDDEDSTSMTLHVDGNVNTKKAGTYHLRLCATDSEENTSNYETLDVTVK